MTLGERDWRVGRRIGVRGVGAVGLALLLAGCSEVKSLVGLDEQSEAKPGAITLNAASTSVPPGGTTAISVTVTTDKGQPAKDGTQVEMKAQLGTVEPAKFGTHDGGTAVVTYRAGSATGAERLTAVAGTAQAELALTIESTPSAPSGPPSGGTPSELSQVIWLDPDISSWPETSRITSVSIGNPPICIDHTKAGQWPVKDGLEGNPWIFVNLNGQWYAATYEWLAPGQICKGISADNIGPHIGRAPLSSWRPRSGELIGLMVSARARFRADTVAERSNIVLMRWP